MRWRIPLLIALVALVAVSCDQQPLEPAADTDLQEATFDSESSARVYTYEVSWTTDVCGVDIVDFTGTLRGIERSSPWGPDDRMYQWMYVEHYNLTGFGRSTGYRWSAVGKQHEHVQTFWGGKGDPEGPEKQIYMGSIKFVGQGSAPDFVGMAHYHETKNANGEDVVIFSLRIPDCS